MVAIGFSPAGGRDETAVYVAGTRSIPRLEASPFLAAAVASNLPSLLMEALRQLACRQVY